MDLHRSKYEHEPQSLFQAGPFAYRPYELSALENKISNICMIHSLDFIIYFILILSSYNKQLYITINIRNLF